MAAVSDVDERPRIQAFECLVELEVEGRKGFVLISFTTQTSTIDTWRKITRT